MQNNEKGFLKMMRKGYFALQRVSKLSQIDEFPSDHLQTT
jgi:hypothetical protein